MAMKRIAIVSNFDDEMYNEQFVNVPPMREQAAADICKLLNEVNPNGRDYYRVVDLDYALHTFQP
jgi:hypothetical protein